MGIERVRDFYVLTKPGIIQGNSLALLAGYLLAASLYGFDAWLMLAVFMGTSLVIGSACVFNNILDRAMDQRMQRTQDRALVRGTISVSAAALYGAAVGLGGFTILWWGVNPLVTLLGLISLVWYVVIYGYAKRTTSWSTLIGSVCGAMPPVAGYTAVTGSIDLAAVILFAILTVWQMPHFYALAIRRKDEYAAVNWPVLPVVRGIADTKRRMIAYMVLFCLTVPWLSIAGYTGMVYLIGSVALAVYWLTVALRTWHEPNDHIWAGRIFGVSLIVLPLQSALIAVGHILP